VFLWALLIAACSTTLTGRRQLTLIDDDKMDALGVAAFADLDAETDLRDSYLPFPVIGFALQKVARALFSGTHVMDSALSSPESRSLDATCRSRCIRGALAVHYLSLARHFCTLSCRFRSKCRGCVPEVTG
jgi:hypothetical protein